LLTCTVSDDICLEGRIDSLTSPEIHQHFEEMITSGNRTIVADLEKVNYMSSAGLRVFMESQKKLKQAGGEIVLFNPSPHIFELLKMSSFHLIFRIPFSRDELESYFCPDSENDISQSTTVNGIAFQVMTSGATPGKLCAIGSQQKMASSSYDGDDAVTISANRFQFGTGLASLGASFEECKQFFGEAMIVNRNFYFYPAVTRPAVDYMLCSQDESTLQYQFLHGFGFSGAFSHRLSFEGKEEFVSLPKLVDALFELVEAHAVGIVFLAESKGFWGMHLKQVPITDNRPLDGKPIFDSSHFSDWINFPIEPSDINHIIAGVGFAVRDTSTVSPEMIALLPKDSKFHFHAGVFAKEPLTKNPEKFDEELQRVSQNLEVFKIQHVLPQTIFNSGLIGIIQLED